MTTQEFSNEFDVLYNNISNNQAPGIDEYEKSIFLTKAQDDIIRDYFNPRNVKTLQGFDDNQKRQYDFSTLIKSTVLTNIDDTLYALKANNRAIYDKFDNRSKVYLAPKDMYLVINESINTTNTRYSVLPINYAEYTRLMLKPYGYPLKRQAWRLISNHSDNINGYGGYYKFDSLTLKSINYVIRARGDYNVQITFNYGKVSSAPRITIVNDTVKITCYIAKDKITDYWNNYLVDDTKLESARLKDYIYPFDGIDCIFPSIYIDETVSVYAPSPKNNSSLLEIIGKFDADDIIYNMRYVRNPKPIILTDLSAGLSIKGEDKISECELPENTHQEILQRAVELAKASYMGDLSSMVQIGNASSTDIGVVPQQTSK